MIPLLACGAAYPLRLDPPTVFLIHFQVSAEALRVSSEVVRVLRPSPSAAVPAKLSPLCQPLFKSVSERLGAQDQDQEVKEAAILCMAGVVATLGDVLSGEVRGLVAVGPWEWDRISFVSSTVHAL